MKVVVDGVTHTLKVDDKVVLKNGQTVTIEGMGINKVLVRTYHGELKSILPEDIVKVLADAVEKIAVSLFQRFINWLRNW
jgi:hypothetical protein